MARPTSGASASAARWPSRSRPDAGLPQRGWVSRSAGGANTIRKAVQILAARDGHPDKGSSGWMSTARCMVRWRRWPTSVLTLPSACTRSFGAITRAPASVLSRAPWCSGRRLRPASSSRTGRSRRRRRPMQRLIKARQERGWIVTFLGEGLDVARQGVHLGAAPAHVAAYAGGRGLRAAGRVMAATCPLRAVRRLCAGAGCCCTYAGRARRTGWQRQAGTVADHAGIRSNSSQILAGISRSGSPALRRSCSMILGPSGSTSPASIAYR
jgi:hypothetical protein